jgi:hypothetical protein
MKVIPTYRALEGFKIKSRQGEHPRVWTNRIGEPGKKVANVIPENQGLIGWRSGLIALREDRRLEVG